MKTSNFIQKSMTNYSGLILCDSDNIPKVYRGLKAALNAANQIGASIAKSDTKREFYYVVK